MEDAADDNDAGALCWVVDKGAADAEAEVKNELSERRATGWRWSRGGRPKYEPALAPANGETCGTEISSNDGESRRGEESLMVELEPFIGELAAKNS